VNNSSDDGRRRPLPLIALILGIAAVVTGCCYGGLPLGIAAIVVVMLCKRRNITNKPVFQTVGLIGGIVGILLSVGSLVWQIISCAS